MPPLIVGDEARARRGGRAAKHGHARARAARSSQVTQLPGFGAWVTGLVPANVVKAAADGAMLPLILFAFVFALAARHIEPPLRQALVDFFGAIAGAMTRLVGWIIALAPIGVFALVVVAASRVGVALAGAMAYYIVAISAVLILFTLLMYPVATFCWTSQPGGIHARRAPGTGGGVELELVARVTAGAGRGVAAPRTSGAGVRVRAPAGRVHVQGRDADHAGSWVSRSWRASTACR